MELAYKEELFFMLSVNMEREEAEKEVERIVNNFKNIFSPKPQKLHPIVGNKMYRYFLDGWVEKGWDMWSESRVDVYEDGNWITFMKFINETRKCKELINRLKLGGNTVIEF